MSGTNNQPNADEGANPNEDLKKQNPGETTTGDLSEQASSDDDDAGQPTKSGGS
jgi:hypothetical protein